MLRRWRISRGQGAGARSYSRVGARFSSMSVRGAIAGRCGICRFRSAGCSQILPGPSSIPLKTPSKAHGIRPALLRTVRGARHYSELTVWKLADELRIETLKLTSRPAFARNLKAQTQAEDAVNSICRNIAEGFGCDSHGQFAWFLRIARRSLNELQDAFRGAEQKGYVTSDDRTPVRALTRRLYPALNRFIAYLDSTPGYRPNRGITKDARRSQPPSKPRTDPR
jgi:four helix bundle protein